MAIASLITAAVSPLLMCVCGLSLFSSLAAIVTGHLAVMQIRNSGGTRTGTGLARAGLTGGYLFAALSIGLLAWMLFAMPRRDRVADRSASENVSTTAATDLPATPHARLLAAESAVLTDRNGVAIGNTAAARQLAQAFAEQMKSQRDEYFSRGKRSLFSLSDGLFITHCELHPGRCAFVVHVPSYRNFNEEAKQALESIAWVTASATAGPHLEPDDELAVALRGVLRYGAVMVGTLDSTAPSKRNLDRDALLPFFEDPEHDATPVERLASGDDAPPTMNAVPEPTHVDAAAAVATAFVAPDSIPTADPTEPAAVPPWDLHRPMAQANLPPTAPQRFRLGDDGAQVASRPQRTPRATASRLDRSSTSGEEQTLPRNVLAQFSDLGWAVKSLAFSPDDRWLAAGKQDRTLIVFDLESRDIADRLDRLTVLDQIMQVAFTADSRQLIAADSRGNIATWQVDSTGTLSDESSLTPHPVGVHEIAVSRAANFFASGDAKGEVLWQSLAANGTKSKRLSGLQKPVLAIHLPDSGYRGLACDGTAMIEFDLRSASLLQTRELGRGSIFAAAFSEDGSRVALCRGAEIEIWNTSRGKLEQTLSAGSDIQWSVAFLPNGKQLISGGRGQATRWDIETGTPQERFDLGGVLYVQTLAISSDGSRLAAIPAAAGQTLSLFQIGR